MNLHYTILFSKNQCYIGNVVMFILCVQNLFMRFLRSDISFHRKIMLHTI